MAIYDNPPSELKVGEVQLTAAERDGLQAFPLSDNSVECQYIILQNTDAAIGDENVEWPFDKDPRNGIANLPTGTKLEVGDLSRVYIAPEGRNSEQLEEIANEESETSEPDFRFTFLYAPQ
jgi:hypothetical protein